MKNLITNINIFTIVTIVGVVVPAVFAQRGMRIYNPATEVTVQGTVEDVKQFTGSRGWGGTHLTLRTDKETLDVHLGPSNFLEAKKFTVSKGDRVEVLGSKVQFQGHDALIARQVTKGDQKLTLRNAQGIPAWSGAGRRN